MRARATLLVLVAACGDDSRAVPNARDVAAQPDLSAATPADFAREIDDAERRGTWREVRARWQGQRMTWRVLRPRGLCESPASCHVAAFDVQQPAQHGWLPRLELAAGEHAKIVSGCGEAARCELEVEGTLAEVVLSAEQPTSLRFADVRVIHARGG